MFCKNTSNKKNHFDKYASKKIFAKKWKILTTKKVQRGSATLIDADKNTGLVILDQKVYIEKPLEFIKNNNFTRLDKNPLNSLIKNPKLIGI